MASDEKDNSSTSFEVDENKISLSESELKAAKRCIYKNLLIIGLSWVFLFTAYNSIANLQSSLNSDAGLGTIGLSITYVCFILSCLLLPTIMIKNLGIKLTIFVCQLSYILYIGLNIYPRYFTLIPSAAILGLGAGPLWTAQSTFLTDLGTHFAKLSGETPELVINRFFGIFFAIFQSSQIWGNLVVSLVLKSGNSGNETTQNVSHCGRNDNPWTQTSPIKKPNQLSVYILCAIFIVCAFVGAFLILIFIDKYRKIGLVHSKEENKSPIQLILNTLKHIKDTNQLLLIPITVWLGFEQAYFLADFTKSFISCIRGVDYVGYVMIVYGVSSTIGSYGFGYMIKLVGRQISFSLAAILNYAAILLQIFWEPSFKGSYVLFIVAVMWGITDAAWNTQISAFYGVIFKSNEEAAFSNLKLWQSVGSAISFAYSNFIGTNVKLYLLIAYLTLGMTGYAIVEFRLKKKDNSSVSNS
ncbi:unnamed protein product [Brachionus calyciflorus]|uniref:UNC93-like protein n=1 Tax=Brachionus calyciflorus TaxID=104777 RepID=A0A813SFH6_9BILA|nr:unnamed protein product [Brachionus calyciflorus]